MRDDLNAVFFNNVADLVNTYGLNKSQVATFLKISRPTVDAWIKREPRTIRNENRMNVTCLVAACNEHINIRYQNLLGQLLYRKHSSVTKELMGLADHDFQNAEKMNAIAIEINIRLAGLHRSNRLSSALAGQKPLI
jgi:hypothetical protein